MNPLTWRGPDFLALYVVSLAFLIGWSAWWLRRPRGRARVRLTEMTADPYLIAALRAGADEALRIAVLNLVDRGLVEVAGNQLKAKRFDTRAFLRRPLDIAIVNELATAKTADQLMRAALPNAAARQYERELSRRGLLADGVELARRARVLLPPWVLLIGFGAAKVAVALAHGRTNVGFLAFLLLVSGVIAMVFFFDRGTGDAREMLTHLSALTKRLRGRAETLRVGSGTPDAVLLAAVFGLAALPFVTFSHIRDLFPRSRGTSDGGSSSCGSSCGSSGCGGGGGCGGCGS